MEKSVYDTFGDLHKPLSFPAAFKTLGAFSSLENALFKPEKADAPYPAVVLVPTCGGVTAHIKERTQELLEAGYAVLVLDNYGPRRQKDCRNGAVSPFLVLKDSYEALAHLSLIKEIDPLRIYQVGYSMGAITAAWSSTPDTAAWTNKPFRFRASVGWYGSCALQAAPNLPLIQFVRPNLDRPLLLLMAENDFETPYKPYCFPLLDDLTARGAPVQWHIYPTGHHAWDQSRNSGYKFTNPFGVTSTYLYDASITADATRRTLEFLKKHR